MTPLSWLSSAYGKCNIILDSTSYINSLILEMSNEIITDMSFNFDVGDLLADSKLFYYI